MGSVILEVRETLGLAGGEADGRAAALARIVRIALECAPERLAVGDVAHAAQAALMTVPEFLMALATAAT